MTTVNIYLTFEDNCEEVFDFYKSIFGGEYQSINRFGEMPPQEGMPPISDQDKDKIMHVSLPISKETILMGSDTMPGGPGITIGNNFSISIGTDSAETADDYFAKLSEGGTINMPLNETFWGSYFGMVTDKYGINWMLNVDLTNK